MEIIFFACSDTYTACMNDFNKYIGTTCYREIDIKTICRSLCYFDTSNSKVEIFDKDIIEIETSDNKIERYIIQWLDEGQMWQAVYLNEGNILDLNYYFYNSSNNISWHDFVTMLINPYGDNIRINVIGNAYDNYDMLNISNNE